MSSKKSIITFAVVGLIAGTAAYLLFGTDEGKKQLKKAKKQIKSLSDELATKSQQGYDRATKFAKKAGNDVSSFAQNAKSHGKEILEEAENTAKSVADRAKKA